MDVTEADRELAGEANSLYEQQKYKECVDVLVKLRKQRPKDDKVKHNLAVAKYCAADRNTVALKAEFDTLVDRAKQEATEGEAHDCLVGAYNSALIAFASRQYLEAANILDDLFRYVEAADDPLARKICFLLLETCLNLRQPERAVRVLAWLEKVVVAGEKERDAREKDQNGRADSENDELQMLRFTLHLYKAKLHLATRSMKLCKREIKSCLNTSSQQCAGLFIKGNFEFLRQNYRKAIKLLNSCATLQGHPAMPVLYYNNLAVIHFQMKKYSMAAFYLNKAFEFNDALRRQAVETKSGPRVMEGDRRYELAYNRGLQLLHAGQPVAALRALALALPVYHSRPRLWLRMMEACVAAHALELKETEAGFKTDVCRKEVGTGVHRKLLLPPTQQQGPSLSSGPGLEQGPSLSHGLWCGRNALALLDRSSTAASSPPYGTQQQASPSPSQASAASTPSASAGREGDALVRVGVLVNIAYISLALADPQAALSAARRVLSDPAASDTYKYLAQLYSAEALITLGQIDEALMSLVPGTTPQFESAYTELYSTATPGGTPNTGSGHTLEYGLDSMRYLQAYPRMGLYLNLAAALCLKGDLDRAQACIAQAIKDFPSNVPHPPQAVLLTAYLDLLKGNIPRALDAIKRHAVPPTAPTPPMGQASPSPMVHRQAQTPQPVR